MKTPQQAMLAAVCAIGGGLILDLRTWFGVCLLIASVCIYRYEREIVITPRKPPQT